MQLILQVSKDSPLMRPAAIQPPAIQHPASQPPAIQPLHASPAVVQPFASTSPAIQPPAIQADRTDGLKERDRLEQEQEFRKPDGLKKRQCRSSTLVGTIGFVPPPSVALPLPITIDVYDSIHQLATIPKTTEKHVTVIPHLITSSFHRPSSTGDDGL